MPGRPPPGSGPEAGRSHPHGSCRAFSCAAALVPAGWNRKRRRGGAVGAFFIAPLRLGKGVAPGGTLDQVDGLLANRRFAEAARMLMAAARSGEIAAITELAHWRIVGN